MIPPLLLAAALLLGACATAAPPPSTARPSPVPPMTLFDFDAPDAPPWTVMNDGVMGGRSQGAVEIADGVLVFTGSVVTRGGGFTSISAPTDADLSAFDGLELRVRGGGRTFEVEVDAGTTVRGRPVSRRAPFETTAAWQTVRVPFAALSASVFGEPVRVGPLDASAVEAIGLYIVDGQDGPFRLEVDWIRAYRADG